ncbi:MAG TPA: DinB family protein [Mucilaginibacter sp.]|nr:DinB family protein [Mucilaginibacter sp.]
MDGNIKREVWLRGPVDGVPPLLQPVAHALLQSREEVEAMMIGFPDIFLWVKPSGMASPAFHLQHLAGVLDRLFTYARGEMLNQGQLDYLAMEGRETANAPDSAELVGAFARQVDIAIGQLRNTSESMLTEARGVGRSQVPSTVIGLLFHAAEHVMRHTGQLLVTTRLLQN